MGIGDIGLLAIQLNAEREKYKKNYDTENYINFLEEKNSQLLVEYNELFTELTLIKDNIKKQDEMSLTKSHMVILKKAIENLNTISESALKVLYNEDSDYRIAFSNLLDWSLIRKVKKVLTPQMLQVNEIRHQYQIYPDKLTFILSELRKYEML